MATIQEAIRRLVYRYSVEGADRVVAANQQVAASSEMTTKASLSLEKQFASLERRYNAQVRAQQDYEKVQRQVNAAVAQNPALQARAVQILAQASQHYDQVTRGQRALIAASQAANDNIRNLAGSAGVLGTTLAALGPAGVAAAAGIGAIVLVLHQMITAATNLAERAGKLKDFSETTGFTVIELQALEKAGAQVGVSAESVSRSLERFSAQMADVRQQTGETYLRLLALNPALARQVAEANSLSRAYELVSDAIKKANVEQGNQLARAFFGRSGVEQTRLMRAVADAGGLKGLIADLHQADIITAKQAERWDELGDKIAENMKAARQNVASIFTEDVLVGMERFSKAFLDLSRLAKEFSLNEDLKTFLDFLKGGLGGFLLGGPGGAMGAIGGRIVSGIQEQLKADDIRQLREELDKLQLARAGATRKLIETDDVNMVRELPGIIQRLDQRITAIKEKLPLQVVPKTTVTVTKEFDSQAEAAAKAQEDFKRETIASYNEMARWMGVIGNAATLAQRYELQTLKLKAAKAQGLISEQQYTQAIEEQKRRLEQQLGVADQSVMIEQRLAEVREVAGKAGLTDEQTRLALIIAEREARERANQAWARANPLMKDLLDTSTQFFESFLQGITSGKSGIESLISSLKGLGNQLMSLGSRQINAGLQSAFASGDFGSLFSSAPGAAGQSFGPGLALAGIGMGISGIMNNMERRRQRQQDMARQQQESQRRIADLRFQTQLVGIDTNTREGALQAFDIQTQQQLSTQTKTGPGGFTVKTDEARAMEDLRRAQRLELIKKFDDAEIAEEKRRQEALEGIRKDLIDRELAAANDNSTRLGALREFDRNAAREREEIAKQSSSLLLQFDKTIAAERSALDKSLLEEIRQRKQSIQDEIFALLNDTTTVEGQVAALDREFARRRQDEIKAGGEALLDLDVLYLVRRQKIYDDANEVALEEQKRAAQEFQEFIAGVRRNITEFLANLRAGPDSPLSPTARLASAQASFGSQLALAQGGDRDALTGITQFASNLFSAAREVFASGAGFQSIFDTVTAQLEALPDIAASADPIVNAIQQQTSDLTRDLMTPSDMTGALGTTYTSGTLKAQIDAVNAVQTATTGVKNSTDAVATNTNQTADNIGDSNTQGLRGLVDTLESLNTVARDQLLIIKDNLTSAAISGVPGGSISKGGQGGSVTLNNNLLQALNKIVFNTGLIAENTGQSAKIGPSPFFNTNWSAGNPLFARGGIAMPGQEIVFGEHHPRGPFFGTVGPDPIAITPGMPPAVVSNDNQDVVTELRALRRENARLTQRLMQIETDIGKAVVGAIAAGAQKGERSQRDHAQRASVMRRTGTG